MAKLHNTLVLVSILGAYGIAHADNTSPTHQPPVNNSSTQISNTISNGYDNTTSNVNLSAYAEVLVVDEVFDPQADALANASVNDIQKNLNNKLNVTDPSKAALRNSVAHVDGNVPSTTPRVSSTSRPTTLPSVPLATRTALPKRLPTLSNSITTTPSTLKSRIAARQMT
ncbi:hypothetical protein [Paludibacterium denitrificans]|uniref:Uncharacterized protein n=1 Tax=Paludibacterium denitrificans TaxID=2675226 RepID=A0A844GG44_9NEIS|nr:hypothetical protein [Paludibacterium denitrificans]MTD33654.1 hypothetical protein [Paludibacterium denitrificans]